MKKLMVVALTLMVMLCFGAISFAGSLDDPAAPTSADSAMYTLENIYDRLDSNTQATKRSGSFTEPTAAPGPTGHTLDQVYEKAIPTQVPKTGQTPTVPLNPAPTGSDGDLQKGVEWPNPRFTDNLNGTVTDNLTGLIWLKDANCFGTRIWADALSDCNNLAPPACSLGDGSVAGDWRLPNIKELFSLLDFAYYSPALSDAVGMGHWTSGDAFTNVQSGNYYWTSTTRSGITGSAFYILVGVGWIGEAVKSNTYYVWPVKGGQ
jgi:hypothetical protein